MNILKSLMAMFFAMAVMVSFGCGGGGGGTPAPPTKATLKLSTAGTGANIRGIEVTVVLPAGVTVDATTTVDPTIMETKAGVVVLSGATVADATAFSQLQPLAAYTPATGTTPGKVKIALAAQKDFALGEFVTVNTVIAAGTVPLPTDFTLEGFTAVDQNGAPLGGITASVAADIK